MPRVNLNPGSTGNVQLGQVDTPILDNDAASKEYVDSQMGGGGTDIPSGTSLPSSATDGDFFFLQAQSGADLPGLYERVSGAWIAGNTNTGVMSVVGDNAAGTSIDFGEGGSTQLQINGQRNIVSDVASNILNLALDVPIWSTQDDYTTIGWLVRTETSVGGETGHLWFALLSSGPNDPRGVVNPITDDGKDTNGNQVWQRASTSHLIENPAGTTLAPRSAIRFTQGGDTTITVSDNAAGDFTEVNISSTGTATTGNAVSWAQTNNPDPIPDDGTAASKLAHVDTWARTTNSTEQIPASKFNQTLNITAAGIVNFDGVQLNVPMVSRNAISVGSNAPASGDGDITYNPATGTFTYTPPVLTQIEGGLVNGSLREFNDLTFSSTQFRQPHFESNLVTGRTEMQVSLREDLVPVARTFADAINTDNTGWGTIRFGIFSPTRTVFDITNTINIDITNDNPTSYPFSAATLESVEVDGVLLDPSQYQTGDPYVESRSITSSIFADAFETATRDVVIHYTVSTSTPGFDPVDVTIRATVYTPVYSGVANDTETLIPGTDPRWQVTWSGTTNTFIPSMGVSEQVLIGLANDTDSGTIFNSGTSAATVQTIQQNAISVLPPQQLGTIGQTVSFEADWTLDTAQLQELRGAASIFLALEVGNASAITSGGLLRLPIPSPFANAQSTREALILLASSVAFVYTNADSARFEVNFSLVPNREDRVNVSVTVSGSGNNNYLFARGSNHLVGFIQGLNSSGVPIGSSVDFNIDSDVTITTPRNPTNWGFSSDIEGVPVITERAFSSNLGPEAALEEVAADILALDPRFTRVGTFTSVERDGINFSVITIDLAVTENISPNFGTMGNSGSNTQVYMFMRDGDPMAPQVGDATTITANILHRIPNPDGFMTSIAISGSRIGSASSAEDIAQLFANATPENPLGTFGFFGVGYLATADGATNTFRYSVPTYIDTLATDIEFIVDNGTGDGDLAVTQTVNNVPGVTSEIPLLVESEVPYIDTFFYDLQRGTHHHLLVPTMALGGASPLFLVLDVDSNITFPWDGSGQAGDVYYSESPISVFGTDYTDFRFTTAYGPDHSIPGGSHIHARGSRVQ